MVQDAGVDFITIHGRTKNQRSSEAVNIEAITALRPHVSVPLLFNGDISTLSVAESITRISGVDGVMSARDILANPALFAGHDNCPWEAVEEFMNAVVRAPIPFKLVVHHVNTMCEGNGGEALLGKQERKELMDCRDMMELIDFLDRVKGIRRF
jgi:tRNA-dihydrouridine synthase 4